MMNTGTIALAVLTVFVILNLAACALCAGIEDRDEAHR